MLGEGTTHYALVGVSTEYHPEKWQALLSLLGSCYGSRGEPTQILALHLSCTATGRCALSSSSGEEKEEQEEEEEEEEEEGGTAGGADDPFMLSSSSKTKKKKGKKKSKKKKKGRKASAASASAWSSADFSPTTALLPTASFSPSSPALLPNLTSLCQTFGLETIVLWHALLIQRRVLVVGEDASALVRFTRSLSLLLWHRCPEIVQQRTNPYATLEELRVRRDKAVEEEEEGGGEDEEGGGLRIALGAQVEGLWVDTGLASGHAGGLFNEMLPLIDYDVFVDLRSQTIRTHESVKRSFLLHAFLSSFVLFFLAGDFKLTKFHKLIAGCIVRFASKPPLCCYCCYYCYCVQPPPSSLQRYRGAFH